MSKSSLEEAHEEFGFDFSSLKSLGLDDDTIALINAEKEKFLLSPVSVFCTCGLEFYSGLTLEVMRKREITCDYRMLAFRHGWDNPEHRIMVKVSIGTFDYSTIIDDLRHKLELFGDIRASQKSDQNWNGEIDRVTCSICEKEYKSLREACYCCHELKSFLPFHEVDTIIEYG